MQRGDVGVSRRIDQPQGGRRQGGNAANPFQGIGDVRDAALRDEAEIEMPIMLVFPVRHVEFSRSLIRTIGHDHQRDGAYNRGQN